MSHAMIKGATSEEMGIVARMTTAESRAGEPTIRAALGEGLALIAELIRERARLDEFRGQYDQPHDDAQWDPPCPDE